MPIMNMVQAIKSALEVEMAADDSVIVLGEDVGVDGGVFRATDGLFDRFGPERVVDHPGWPRASSPAWRPEWPWPA